MSSVFDSLQDVLPRETRAVLFADVVESVRLVEENESDFLALWLDFLDGVRSEILPRHAGRLVKGLGDGFMAEFDDARSAVAAAFAVREQLGRRNRTRAPGAQAHLRMGIEAGEVILTGEDLYGRGVNRAARLMTLAGPGEICVSAAVRDGLTADLDADLEDLGECYVKHLAEPVRTYRIRPPTGEPSVLVGDTNELLPALAVIPFSTCDEQDVHHVLGEVLAEELIRNFSRTTEFNVISRLSTTAFRSRDRPRSEMAKALRAEYLLTGRYEIADRHVVVATELVDGTTGHVVCANRARGHLDGILTGRHELVDEIASAVCAAVMTRAIVRAQSQRIANLQSYTLLIAATALMHRLSSSDFADARRLLEALIERAPRQAIPKALLAKWHVLRVQQGWSTDVAEDARQARLSTQQALAIDPHCSLALAVDGFVFTNLLRSLDEGRDRYDRALQSNPNDSLAWLLRGTLHAFMGEGTPAVRCTRRALALSPLDPHRYFYDSLAATAYLAARQFDRALAAARRSFRANRTHTSTLRAMAVAQWHLGATEDARRTATKLLQLEPTLTVSSWLARSPSAAYPIGQEWAETFRQIGLPS